MCCHLGKNTRLPEDGATFILSLEDDLINPLLEEGGSVSSVNKLWATSMAHHCQDRVNGNSQSAASSLAVDSNLQAVSCGGITDSDLVSNLSQNISSSSEVPYFVKDKSGLPSMQHKNEMDCDGVADDSQTEDNDLYLSDCRILLVGFEASEMRKLVNIMRRGGASRYMSFNEKLTHIVGGTPSEIFRPVSLIFDTTSRVLVNDNL